MRVTDALDARKEELSELRSTNNSLVSTNQNEIIRKLAVLTFIGMPASITFALFGTNAEFPPIVGYEGDFWAIFTLAFITTFGLFLLVRVYRWL